jgi:hypothetical protein
VLADPHAVEPGGLGVDNLADRLAQGLTLIEPGARMPLAGEDAQTDVNHGP